MRHRKHNQQLGVKKEHRKGLLANLASALLEHGRIETTLAKAKALRPFAERVITLAKRAQKASPERALYLRRLAISRVRNKGAVHVLFEERVAEFVDRKGGYIRIYKLGGRIGDGAEMAIVELIDAADEGYRNSRRKRKKSDDKSTEQEHAPAEVEEEPVSDDTGGGASAGESEAEADESEKVADESKKEEGAEEK